MNKGRHEGRRSVKHGVQQGVENSDEFVFANAKIPSAFLI